MNTTKSVIYQPSGTGIRIKWRDKICFFSKNYWKKEWAALEKKEQRYLDRQREEKSSSLMKKVSEKIPEKLEDTLKSAFSKAFEIVFEKGTGEKMIETALLHGEELEQANMELNEWIEHGIGFEIDRKEQISKTSDALAEALLYMKFVQGIPVVGVAGGLADAVYLKKITDYADLKYKRRCYCNLRDR